jgi:adenylylsulfate kinase
MHNNFVIPHDSHVKKSDRNQLNNHMSGIIWFTGLSAAGKSTIAHLVEKEFFKQSVRTYVLDGDNVRHGINSDLGFSREERRENLRRIVEISKLFVDAGIFVLAAFITPYQDDRAYIRKQFENDNFLEIYVKCSLEECEKRDPKGQYRKARAGIIQDYTGVSSPYEEPKRPDLIINTEKLNLENSVNEIITFLYKKRFLQ